MQVWWGWIFILMIRSGSWSGETILSKSGARPPRGVARWPTGHGLTLPSIRTAGRGRHCQTWAWLCSRCPMLVSEKWTETTFSRSHLPNVMMEPARTLSWKAAMNTLNSLNFLLWHILNSLIWNLERAELNTPNLIYHFLFVDFQRSMCQGILGWWKLLCSLFSYDCQHCVSLLFILRWNKEQMWKVFSTNKWKRLLWVWKNCRIIFLLPLGL